MKAQQQGVDTSAMGSFMAAAPAAPVFQMPMEAAAPQAMPVFAAAAAQEEPVDEADGDEPTLSDADQFEKDTTSLTNAGAETTTQVQ